MAVILLLEGVAGVNLQPGDTDRAVNAVGQAGTRILQVNELMLKFDPCREKQREAMLKSLPIHPCTYISPRLSPADQAASET